MVGGRAQWTFVGRGTATAGVLVLTDPCYVLPRHRQTDTFRGSRTAGPPCPRDPGETWPSVRSKLTGRPIHPIWLGRDSHPCATLVEGLGEDAPYDILARGTVEVDELGDEYLIDELRLLFPTDSHPMTPSSDDAPGWRLVRGSGPIDSGMFAVLDPLRALDDPERSFLGIHYDHDVRREDFWEPKGGGAAPEPPVIVEGVAMFRDGAMWIENRFGGDAPYDLAARFEGRRVVEVSFRINGIRLGSRAH